ncbi:MarR family winged helix-turn-helix transcriptional regulator [Pseudaestuariivita sp.]|uniref:MarR family winged helix-turn-helix transcriptional regulator n=1 Tax=Pseudaestuariivita sp. TaxID=2211669 RepID=UPI004059AB91
MRDAELPIFFGLFNEIGILNQLSRTAFEAVLPDGLLVTHFSVLNHLIRVQDGQTPLKLASAFQVPKTSMTHTLAGLEKRGFVEMRPNPKDARSKCVWITEAGRRFREEAIVAISQALRGPLSEFPVSKAWAVLPVLAELRAILDAARD